MDHPSRRIPLGRAQCLGGQPNLITDFRVRRVQTEIIAFAKICETQRQLMEEAYRRIVPGVTTREELGWWFQEQLLSNGLITLPSGLNAPSASYSTAPGLTGEVSHSERENVYQRGDFLTWDVGLRYLNFGTDFKRKAYILKEGETSLPAGIQFNMYGIREYRHVKLSVRPSRLAILPVKWK